jgi:hypothetical protein
MARVVLITWSDYRAIMQLDEDGASNADITYEIVPDLVDSQNNTPNWTNLGEMKASTRFQRVRTFTDQCGLKKITRRVGQSECWSIAVIEADQTTS